MRHYRWNQSKPPSASLAPLHRDVAHDVRLVGLGIYVVDVGTDELILNLFPVRAYKLELSRRELKTITTGSRRNKQKHLLFLM